jgi:hypothetical protein
VGDANTSQANADVGAGGDTMNANAAEAGHGDAVTKVSKAAYDTTVVSSVHHRTHTTVV